MKRLMILLLFSVLSCGAQTFTNGWSFKLDVSDQIRDDMKFLKRQMEKTNSALTNVSLKDFSTNYVTAIIKPDVAEAIRNRRNRLISLIQSGDDAVLKTIEDVLP